MSVQVAPDVEAMIRDLRASLIRAKEQVERGEFVEWSPNFMEQLSQEADELVAQGYQPKPDVCP